jgi:heme O synthase-like polyprenyltransferase
MKLLNKIVLYTLIGICILVIMGLLNFGHGLGNILYFPPIIIATILHILLTRKLIKRNNNSYWFPLIFIFSIVCILILYKATFGRGGEFSWNGDVLFIK